MIKTFDLPGKTVTIHYSIDTIVSNCPIVYLHTIEGNGSSVWQQCCALDCPPSILVSIPVQNWNNELTPWECEGLFAEDEPFQGNAHQQLSWLESAIPRIEESLGTAPSHRVLAGYSLAGLFAAWAPFNTALFDSIASASGSLWYPDFCDYVKRTPFAKSPQCAYFSLGSKEARTPSRLLRNVAAGTSSVVSSFQERGIETVFESNPGNHFKEPDLRMAKGICWVLRHLQPSGAY